MSTYNRLDLQTLGSQPVMPKNLPDHCPTVIKTIKWTTRIQEYPPSVISSVLVPRLKPDQVLAVVFFFGWWGGDGF